MRVPARCLGLCMAEELAYKGKAQPGPRPDRSEAVPQVVNPHIGQIDSVPLLEFLSPNRFLLLSLCQRLHPPPGALQVLQVVVRVLRGGNYPAHHLGSLSQQLQRRGAEDNDTLACFRVRQKQDPSLVIHVLPAQREDFSQPAAGEQQEADRPYCGLVLLGIGLHSAQDLPQPVELRRGEVSFPLLLLKLVNVSGGVRAVRPQAPLLSEVEHLTEQRQNSIGKVWTFAQGVVQTLYIFPCNGRHLVRTELRKDVILEHLPVILG